MFIIDYPQEKLSTRELTPEEKKKFDKLYLELKEMSKTFKIQLIDHKTGKPYILGEKD